MQKPFQSGGTDSTRADLGTRRMAPLISTNQMKDGKVVTNDRAFVASFATDQEITQFAAVVRARRAREPKFRHAICQNPKCGRVFVLRYEAKPLGNCLSCNYEGPKDHPGQLREMTLAEVEKFKADEDRQRREFLERSERAEFAAINEGRRKAGLKDVTFEEWRKERQKAQAKQAEMHQALYRSAK